MSEETTEAVMREFIHQLVDWAKELSSQPLVDWPERIDEMLEGIKERRNVIAGRLYEAKDELMAALGRDLKEAEA